MLVYTVKHIILLYNNDYHESTSCAAAREICFEFPPSLLFIIFRIFVKRDYSEFCGGSVCPSYPQQLPPRSRHAGIRAAPFIRGVKKSLINITSTKSRSTTTQPLFPFGEQIFIVFYLFFLFLPISSAAAVGWYVCGLTDARVVWKIVSLNRSSQDPAAKIYRYGPRVSIEK